VWRSDGVWLIEPKFEDVNRLSDGRYAARMEGKDGVLLTDGTWLVEPLFEDLKPLTESHIVARAAGKYGVYDTRAKAWVVEPQSDEMCGFFDKYAIGITDRLRTIFDAHTGEMLIGPRYNRLSLAFNDGLVAVRVGDKWGYADVHGDLVIPAQFRNMSMFRHGIAWGEHEGKVCPLDRRGRWVEGIPCVDPEPGELEDGFVPSLCGH